MMTENDRERDHLPYRETSDCFLIYNGKIIAKDSGHYVAYPGGGVDEGETPLQAAKREIKEEVGATVTNLKHLGSINWIWHPEWADTPKRKERYSKYKGELVHFMFGIVKSIGKPTSEEGDGWEGDITMDADEAFRLSVEYSKNDKPNIHNYREAQQMVLQLVKMLCKFESSLQQAGTSAPTTLLNSCKHTTRRRSKSRGKKGGNGKSSSRRRSKSSSRRHR